MINAKKLLTRAVATLTCAVMLAGSSLSSFAAGIVSIDTSKMDEFYDDVDKITIYSIETPDYWFWWGDEEGYLGIDANVMDQFGIEAGSVIILGGNVYKIEGIEYDKEWNWYYANYSFVGTEEDYFGDSYVDNIGKKIYRK